MHRLSIIIAAVCTCAITACSSPNEKTAENATTAETKPKYEGIAAASWLTGSWTCPAGDATVIETWATVNDSTLAGKSVVVKGKDTLPQETILLTQRGTEVAYTPTVANQNAGQPVKFVQTKADGKEWIFENPAHDFPQTIKYTKVTDDSLVATVSGKENGKMQEMSFPMKRMK